jgi:hypothetical protein
MVGTFLVSPSNMFDLLSGGHFEFMIDTKNARLVKSHPWNIPAVFGFIWFSGFREELYKNSFHILSYLTTFSSDSEMKKKFSDTMHIFESILYVNKHLMDLYFLSIFSFLYRSAIQDGRHLSECTSCKVPSMEYSSCVWFHMVQWF